MFISYDIVCYDDSIGYKQSFPRRSARNSVKSQDFSRIGNLLIITMSLQSPDTGEETSFLYSRTSHSTDCRNDNATIRTSAFNMNL